MSITDKEVFKDYYNDTLGELIEYDKNNDSNILEVLKYYLENNGSVQKNCGTLLCAPQFNKLQIKQSTGYTRHGTAYNCGLLLW